MKYLMIVFVVSFLVVSAFSQNMIADIKTPVATDFGTFNPYLVSITPNAEPCVPGEELQHVVNLADFRLSAEALQRLQQNHFVVMPARRENSSAATGYNEIFDVYNECREQGIPIFVTSDALLHTFHLCFDRILMTCEQQRFIEQLNDLLTAVMNETIAQHKEATDPVVQTAAMSNLNYLIVARKLLDSTYVEPINGGPYLEELELVGKQVPFTISPIFGYEEDYTQYKVRGHYTRSDSLKHYFQSMMWLGRMTFSCERVEEPVSRDATRRAILLVQAMSRARIGSAPALDYWEDIYLPTVFFVGKSDDIQVQSYLDIAYQVYGKSFPGLSPDTFANEEKLTGFLEATKALPPAAITYPGQPTKGFRFMGQRFIPDSYVLDEVVFNKIPDLRLMPTGLDVMAVLGSKRAMELIQQTPDWAAFPSYREKLPKLMDEFEEYPDETWAQNVYWNWLYCLMPLLSVKETGYPIFMQSPAWVDKDLFAALASWAELRHDTILYAKQSGTEKGLPPGAYLRQGYVEPNPHFFARLAALADFMITGLQQRDLLFPSFKVTCEKLSALLQQLQTISEKELLNLPLTGEEYLTIFKIGQTLFDIASFSRYMNDGPLSEAMGNDMDPMPVIADVHTDANSGLVLEEGVGYPYVIYVLTNVEGRPTLTKGAGFSYYEFTWPMTDRLTDEQWREMLEKGTNPKPPAWAQSFALLGQSDPIKPDFYLWEKPRAVALTAHVEPETPSVGTDVSIHISYLGYDSPPQPKVWLTSETGSSFEITDLQPENDTGRDWLAVVPAQLLSRGTYFVDVTSGDTAPLQFRTQFTVQNGTGVDTETALPDDFMLYQNYPNPFNPVTHIVFDLPVESHVELQVFDLQGRLVDALLSGIRPAGRTVVRWNTNSVSGRTLSSGVYYYRLRAGDFVDVKRMVLLR